MTYEIEQLCKCGNKSIGGKRVLFHTKKNGEVSRYEYPDKRCRDCKNRQKYKKDES